MRRNLARVLSRYYPVLDTDEKGKDLLQKLSLIPIVIPSRCYHALARGGVLRTPEQLQHARLHALVAQPQPPLSAAQQEALRGLLQIAQDEFRVQDELLVRAPDGVSLLSNRIVRMTDHKSFVVSAALLDPTSAHNDPEWGFRCVSPHFGTVDPAAVAAAAGPCHCAVGHAVHVFRWYLIDLKLVNRGHTSELDCSQLLIAARSRGSQALQRGPQEPAEASLPAQVSGVGASTKPRSVTVSLGWSCGVGQSSSVSRVRQRS